jgi:hypothetical protein
MATAQHLFEAGVGLVLSHLRLSELVSAIRVCKTWYKAAHVLPVLHFSVTLGNSKTIRKLVLSPLTRRHVSNVTVYSTCDGTSITQLSAMKHLSHLWISIDGEAQASKLFVFPPALINLRIKFIRSGTRVIPINEHEAKHASRWLPQFFSAVHFGQTLLLESLEVDLEYRPYRQLNLAAFPRLRSFRYLVDGSERKGYPSLAISLFGADVWNWRNGNELNTHALQLMAQSLPNLEKIGLSSYPLLTLRFINCLMAFRASLTDISPRKMREDAVPLLVHFVKLQRLVLHLYSNDARMTGAQLLRHLPRSLTSLTLSGIALTTEDRALFMTTLPLVETFDSQD